ncbi:type III secretion system export apparatus subunit SctT [Salmonella enterica]|nr:EscT/YscT/HrcT family type III secretion system export apparatus protein [Salmonella enterica subsp. enterica serovar Sandiego]EEC0251375.1 EscT/YscT/HrcT family type III secretion system export apparatus protein [Salmonella enterica subsp. enterica]EJW2128687.1 type III secretion system export apparatus subunit SctT [Salmonella enterica]EEE4266739.1 EscT/YscT/HrcT family type III secretion system export apparatus protein [Salmonella enterica subsp. enterica serovar Sandiego]EKT1704579.1 typ
MEVLDHWWPLLGVAIMRPLGVMFIFPLFGPAMLGGTLIRNALALMATLPILPLLSSLVLPNPMQAPMHYTLMLAAELCIGLMLGFSAAIPLWALDIAGYVIDTIRGASIASIFNPLQGGQSSPVGAFFSQLAGVFFMILGGFHALMNALFASYTNLQPGQRWYWSGGFLLLLEHLWHDLYTLALGFTMPAIVIMVLTDLALGLINRSVQQLNVFTLSMPIKSIMVLLIMIMALPFAFSEILDHFVQFDGGLLMQLGTRP